jgi:hypothetical protein
MSGRIALTLTEAQAAYIGRRAAKLRLDVPETIRRIIDSDMLKHEGIIPEWFVHTSFNSWFRAQRGRGDNVGAAARYCPGDLSGPKAFCVWVAEQAADNAYWHLTWGYWASRTQRAIDERRGVLSRQAVEPLGDPYD